MNIVRCCLGIMVVYALNGCDTLNPPFPGTQPDYAPTYPADPDPKQVRHLNGAIYNPETALPLFETPRARHPGDLVTVILIEKTDAQKKATTFAQKNDQATIEDSIVFGRPVALGANYSFDMSLNAQRQFNGGGQEIQNNKLAGNISVTISKVLANGNMMIQGEKWVKINQGDEYIRLSGIIRPQDIKPDNSVTSDRIANARIAYGGVGQLNNMNAQGWLARFVWGPLYPN